MVRQIFVNLPVKNLKRTMAFFSALGFRFNKDFTDKKAASMIIGRNMYAMLLVEKFFKSFLKKKGISDARKKTEVITALELKSKREVDAMLKKAFKAGARKAGKRYDYGYMYGQAIEDLDGHIWEFFWFDLKGFRKANKK